MNWENVISSWKAISAAGTAVVAATAAVFGGVEYVDTARDEVISQVRQNTEKLEAVAGAVERIQNDKDLDRWQYLNKKRQSLGLTLIEYQEFCALGKKLFEGYTCPQFEPRDADNG